MNDFVSYVVGKDLLILVVAVAVSIVMAALAATAWRRKPASRSAR